mgnify:CR=1 FL=1
MFEDYDKIRSLGIGSYGNVYLYENKNGNKIALKKIFHDDDTELIYCEKINDLNIKGLVKFLGKENKNIYYEFIEGRKLTNFRFTSSFNNYLKILHNVVNILYELEQKGYYYLDISKENILIQKNNIVRLIDYSTLCPFDKEPVKGVGSYLMIPPESFLKNEVIKNKFDVFSIGILLYEYLFFYNPITKMNNYKKSWVFCKHEICSDKTKCLTDNIEKLFNNNRYNKDLSENNKQICKKILQKCLSLGHLKRWSIKELFHYLELIDSDVQESHMPLP